MIVVEGAVKELEALSQTCRHEIQGVMFEGSGREGNLQTPIPE